MAGTKLPTAELVAVAYVKRVLATAGVTAPVSTTLADAGTWATTGAIQVDGIVGSTSREGNLRDVVVGLSGWGARPGSDKPPWGQANGLLELVRDSAFQDVAAPVLLELEPANTYRPVMVQSATTLGVQGEPRRMADPDTSRAHYVMELRLFWVVA